MAGEAQGPPSGAPTGPPAPGGPPQITARELDGVFKAGDEALAAVAPPAPPPGQETLGNPIADVEARAKKEQESTREEMAKWDERAKKPWGCMATIMGVVFAAVIIIVMIGAASVGTNAPSERPTPSATAGGGDQPESGPRPPATSAPAEASPTSSSAPLPEGGVQPPTEIIPVPGGGETEDDGSGEEPPSTSEHQENPCINHPDEC